MTDISDEYKKMLRGLYEEARPERQEGEFTVDEYWGENKDRIKSRDLAEKQLEYMYRSGRLTKPPKRYIGNHLRVVYKKVSPSKNVE